MELYLVETTSQSEDTQKTDVEKKKPITSATRPEFQGGQGLINSGVGISDLYGEVLIELYDDDGNFIDSYSPILGAELHKRNHIYFRRG